MSKSIRSVLEKINPCMCKFTDGFAHDENKPCHCSAGKLNDQALKDIAQIIDEAKPEQPTRYDDMDNKTDYHKRGYKLGVDQYQSNLREALL